MDAPLVPLREDPGPVLVEFTEEVDVVELAVGGRAEVVTDGLVRILEAVVPLLLRLLAADVLENELGALLRQDLVSGGVAEGALGARLVEFLDIDIQDSEHELQQVRFEDSSEALAAEQVPHQEDELLLVFEHRVFRVVVVVLDEAHLDEDLE